MRDDNSRFGNADAEDLRKVFQETEIRRIPITGFVTGYHTLPFTLIGPDRDGEEDPAQGSLKLTGKIQVSPKIVFSISPREESYGEIFAEEDPFMDRSITGRVFAFGIANRKNLKIRNEHLTVEEFPGSDSELLANVLDELDRRETVNMGVIWCPRPRLYPVSLERFILSVVDKELR